MNKKLKLGLLIGVPVLLIAVGLTLFFTLRINSGNGNLDSNPAITLSQYNQLEKGMTYKQVSEILGSDGTLQSENGVKDNGGYIATYVWYGKTKNAKAVITFNGDLLGVMTYIGLTD